MSPPVTRVEADVCFSIEVPDRESVTGSLTGSGSHLTLRVSDPAVFAGGADAGHVRRIALELADVGLVLRVADADDRSLVVLGRVHAPWWQRAVTRSPHMRVGGLRGIVAAGRGRLRDDAAALPGHGVLPPGTPYPLAPMFLRRPVRRVTTTHDPARGGGPRLVAVPADGISRAHQPVFWLQSDCTTIGSDAECDIVLAGLAPFHAEVRHDDSDEFVVVARDGEVRVHGEPTTRRVLRTSARVELGDRVLVFAREEYADHGRPYGGRIGGELGRQRPQPPRPAAGTGFRSPAPDPFDMIFRSLYSHAHDVLRSSGRRQRVRRR